MNKTMSLKGFIVILGFMAVVYLVAHSVLGRGVDEKAAREKELRVELTRLEERNKELSAELNVVGTQEYIMSSAVRDYAYVKRNAIRFEYTNPEAIYAFTEEEMAVYLDEINDGGESQ